MQDDEECVVLGHGTAVLAGGYIMDGAVAVHVAHVGRGTWGGNRVMVRVRVRSQGTRGE